MGGEVHQTGRGCQIKDTGRGEQEDVSFSSKIDTKLK